MIEGSPHWNGKVEPAVVRHPALLRIPGDQGHKMHIRVLLSKYRSYTPCPAVQARLKTESLLWRIGRAGRRCGARPAKRFMPQGVQWTRAQLEQLPGLCLHDLMLLPIDRLRLFLSAWPRVRVC